MSMDIDKQCIISIHAPPRGATHTVQRHMIQR